MSDKLDKLNGKKIAVTFDFAEAGA